NIFDVSMIDSGKFEIQPQVLDVDQLCRSSLAFVQAQATQKSVSLFYEGDKALSQVYADPLRLKQILVNLLNNAVKFTPSGGQVILQVHADTSSDRIEFSVTDTGIGIAPNEMK